MVVQRDAHLSPDHMKAAVERLARPTAEHERATGTNGGAAVARGSAGAQNLVVSRPGNATGTPCLKVRVGRLGRRGTNDDGVSRCNELAVTAVSRGGLY